MYFDVDGGHKLYYEEFGNPKGIDVLFIHGGPGLGFSEADKKIFDPEKFHVLFIDQRGCGKSMPKGRLEENTTAQLIQDIHAILEHTSMQEVVVFGGSWGATLAVLFAAIYPEKVNQLILRGFFPATKECADIYLRGRLQETHHSDWQQLLNSIPSDHHSAVPEYVFDRISNKKIGCEKIGYEWARYGFSLSRKTFANDEVDRLLDASKIDYDRICIELYYALNSFFIPDGRVLNQAQKIKNIQTTIIHGKYDYICPLSYAEKLAVLIHKSTLKVVDGGHSLAEHEVRAAVLKELEQL